MLTWLPTMHKVADNTQRVLKCALTMLPYQNL